MSSRLQKRKREPSNASTSKIRRSSLDSPSNPIVESEWRPAREDMFTKPLDERALRSAASIRSPIATRRRTTMFGSTTGTSRSIPVARFYGGQSSQQSEQMASNGVPLRENSKTKLSTVSSKGADGSGELHLPGRRRQSPGTARSKLTRLRRPADHAAAVPQQQKHHPQRRSLSSNTAAGSASETKSDAKRSAAAVPTRHTAAAAPQPADTAAGHRATVRATDRDAGLALRTATSAVAPPHASSPAETAPPQSAATSATLAAEVTAPSQQEEVVNELPSEKKHLEASVFHAQPEAKLCVAGATHDQLLVAAASHQPDVVPASTGNPTSHQEKLPSATIGVTSRSGREQLVAESPGTLAAGAVATPQTAKRPRGRPPRTTPAVRVAVSPPDKAVLLSTPSATSSDDERHSAANSTSAANDHAAEVAGDSIVTEVAGAPGSNTTATTSTAAADITNGTAGPTPATGNSECATGNSERATGNSACATSESYTVLTSFEAGDSYSTTSKWCIVM